MQVLTKEDIQPVFSMKDAINAAKLGFELHSRGKAYTPLRTHLTLPSNDRNVLFMPSFVDELNALGIKVVSIFGENIKKGLPTLNAQMLVMNAETGIIEAVIDGSYLTQLRTGALSGAATDLLANAGARIMTLIGTGGQALEQLNAVLEVRDITKVNVYSLSIEETTKFIEKACKIYPNVDFNPVSNTKEVIAESDIITTVTTSKKPTFDGNLVKQGTHINAVGSYTPEMHELDAKVLQKASIIYFDTMNGVLSEAGDIITPLNSNDITKDDITGEVGELLLGKTSGRKNENEITIFKTVGAAVFDIVTAHLMYQNYKQS